MSFWAWTLIALVCAALIFLFASLMEVSSRNSRREEEYIRLHPPDPDRKLDNDTSADRCVCCGEIIPEGRHVCSSCEQKQNRKQEQKQDTAWW